MQRRSYFYCFKSTDLISLVFLGKSLKLSHPLLLIKIPLMFETSYTCYEYKDDFTSYAQHYQIE